MQNPEHIAKMEEIKPEVKEEVGLDGITKKLRKPRVTLKYAFVYLT